MRTNKGMQSGKQRSVGGLKAPDRRATEGTNAKERGSPSPRPTQGHEKAIQQLEDLWQNDGFQAELAKILSFRDPHERDDRLFELAEVYSLGRFMEIPFRQLLASEKTWPQDLDLDFCRIADEVDEILKDPEHDNFVAQPSPKLVYRLSMMRYPIHICISPLASKRDVLDYVAKRWSEIRDLLDAYTDAPVIRKRPKAARDRFIWEHREVPSRQLAEMVRERFPGERVEYFDIDSIKHHLKKRNSRL